MKKKKKKEFQDCFLNALPHNGTANKERNPPLNTFLPSEVLPCILELSNDFPMVINQLPSQTWTQVLWFCFEGSRRACLYP